MRILGAALACALVVAIGAGTPAVATGRGPCSAPSYSPTLAPNVAASDWRARHLIRCVFTYLGLGGQTATAQAIAERESGLYVRARNASSGAAGLFQHLPTYWPGRVRSCLGPWRFPRYPNVSIFNPRANTWAAACMVRSSGWAAWGG